MSDVLRGIVFDEEAARAIQQQLLADGYDATVTRDRYAGEDDDEDHPWAVVTDAPAVALDLLLDAHDGWLEEPDAAVDASTPPLDLPAAPRRRHR